METPFGLSSPVLSVADLDPSSDVRALFAAGATTAVSEDSLVTRRGLDSTRRPLVLGDGISGFWVASRDAEVRFVI